MPNLLSVPREIRDEIYEHALQLPLQSSTDPTLQRDRKRVFYSGEDRSTYYGEQMVRYPVQTTLPPSNGLLRATRQLRAEFLDTVKRLGPIRYKVDLTDRRDKGHISPTWIYIPLLTDKIDILEAQWRIRSRKTSSIVTFNGDEATELQGQQFSATLAMLERFVERGVYLLSKKKRKSIHIGILAVNMDTPDDTTQTEGELWTEEVIKELDQWMVDVDGSQNFAWDEEAREREDRQFRFLATKIDRIHLSLHGVLKKEWVLQDMVSRRDEEAARRLQEDLDLDSDTHFPDQSNR